MITLAKMMFLRRFPLFGKMSSRVLSLVATVTDEVVFSRGTVIFNRGDFGDCMYLIVEGKVRIHIGPVRLAVLGEAEEFGEMGVLDGEARSASATAETDCLALRVKKEEFHRILARSPEACLEVLKTLSRRLRKVQEDFYGKAADEAGTPSKNGGDVG